MKFELLLKTKIQKNKDLFWLESPKCCAYPANCIDMDREVKKIAEYDINSIMVNVLMSQTLVALQTVQTQI